MTNYTNMNQFRRFAFRHLLVLTLTGLAFSCKKDDNCKPASTANAGTDQNVIGTTTTLGATSPASGVGTWTLVGGDNGTITNPLDPASAFTGVVGNTYTLKWSVTGCPSSDDEVIVAFICDPAGAANAGPDQSVSGTSATLAANASAGTWTIVSGTGGSITNASSPTSTFTGTSGTTYVLRWTVSCPQSQDDVQITFQPSNVDPALLSVDKTSVIDGEIITFTGTNFAANYNGASQVNLVKADAPNQGNDVFLPILSRTSTEIKAVAQGVNGGLNGAYSVRYVKRPDTNPASFISSSLTINIVSGPANQFFTSSTFTNSNVTKGSEASFGIKNGSLAIGDYTVKLVAYNIASGATTEYNVVVTAITAGGYGGSMDKLAFTVPSDLPAESYKVKVTYANTTVIGGWGTSLNVN